MRSVDDFLVPRSAGKETLEIIRDLAGIGPRFPGSGGQEKTQRYIESVLESSTKKIFRQPFNISLFGREVSCTNIIASFENEHAEGHDEKHEEEKRRPILIGTHYDTRLRADREESLELKARPIEGANDGGSGTAILLWLSGILRSLHLEREILLVFFDAEDVGDIDGNDFSMGAAFFASEPVPAAPEEVIILDMVGGKNMVLDIDAHLGAHMESFNLTREIWRIGMEKGFRPFTESGNGNIKYIICDHIPFLLKNITSTLLIDLNYPEWHTQRDTIDNISEESLWIIEEVLVSYLLRYSSEYSQYSPLR